MPAASSQLTNLLNDLRTSKLASLKAAGTGLGDPGGYQGASSHPSAKSLDDGLMASRTGSRAAENEADVKKTIPSPNVDETPEGKPEGGEGTPGQDKVQYGIGVTQSSTGQDPSVEDDYKDKHSDPGTTQPAKADMGEKYSALIQQPFDKLAGKTTQLGNALLAGIVNRKTATTGSASIQVTPSAPAPTSTAAEKQAAMLELVEATIKEAVITADLVADEIHARIKAAEAPPDAPHEPKSPGPGGPDAGGPPDMPLGADAGPGGPPGAGGPPALPPGLGAAAEGGPGMDAPPDAGGPPASPEEAMHELAAAFQDMGMSPEDVMMIAQKMSESAGALGGAGGPGGPGGAPPMGGPPMPGPGGPPEAKMAALNDLYKAASRVKQLRHSGRFIYGPPKTARAESIRKDMLATVADILGTR